MITNVTSHWRPRVLLMRRVMCFAIRLQVPVYRSLVSRINEGPTTVKVAVKATTIILHIAVVITAGFSFFIFWTKKEMKSPKGSRSALRLTPKDFAVNCQWKHGFIQIFYGDRQKPLTVLCNSLSN